MLIFPPKLLNNPSIISQTKYEFMRKRLRFSSVLSLAFFLSLTTAFAQTATITGSVKNASSKESVSAVSVTVKDGTEGTFTDANGNFRLTVKKLPVTLLISSVGFETQEITVSSADAPTEVNLNPASTLG